ncbi:synaptobrevin homolog YKT6-like [Nomascus leucogenys]|uniref:synaptobrevin homolog YKT6-like n=1 Tax=Nomascus leucogenys TaxID=61853 RepID=UPI00122D6AAD|nr:synaptobrevin homolog YKT6-like [Nomascus leucogenys]
MKLYSLSVLYKGEAKVVLLKAGYDDVASFSFFQRSSVQEFTTFMNQLIVECSSKGTRASVEEQDYLWHVYVRNDSLAGVVIADNECPSRVAFTLLEKVLDEFSKQVNRIDWPVGSPATIHSAALDGHLSRYQNPRDADTMTNVQAEPDKTQIIVHNTMKSLLEQGEKLGALVSKSEVLGTQSKAFYKTARKQNSCCAVAQHWNSTIIRIRTEAPRDEETALLEDLEWGHTGHFYFEVLRRNRDGGWSGCMFGNTGLSCDLCELMAAHQFCGKGESVSGHSQLPEGLACFAAHEPHTYGPVRLAQKPQCHLGEKWLPCPILESWGPPPLSHVRVGTLHHHLCFWQPAQCSDG